MGEEPSRKAFDELKREDCGRTIPGSSADVQTQSPFTTCGSLYASPQNPLLLTGKKPVL